MGQSFLDPGGSLASESSLTLRRARELVAALQGPGATFAALIECRSSSAAETVVLEVEVERPQLVANDIHLVERLAAVFSREDETYPEVLALRPDFPATMHMNQRLEELPRSLCLYDQPWSEVRTRWTAPAFIERVRWWLRETARDSLHAEDQALESFVLSAGRWLVLPVADKDGREMDCFYVTVPGGKDGNVFVACKADSGERQLATATWVVLRFRMPPRRHGVLPRTPGNLRDLCSLLGGDGSVLLDMVRNRLRQTASEALKQIVILLLELPKTRREDGPDEDVEHAALLTGKTLLDLGVAVGVWAVQDNKRAFLLRTDSAKDGVEVPVLPLNVCRAFARGAAAALNGIEDEKALRIVAVGAGALGSQVAMNLSRAGWGKWTIVDADYLLPHNLARHAMDGRAVGCRKSDALAFGMNCVFMNHDTAVSIAEDVLRPKANAEKLQEALRSAEVVLDMSASVATSRHLASVDVPARRISLFLSRSGKDLVLLGEDLKRRISLDHLEMSYYTALATEESLVDHLGTDGRSVRYGLSCSDVSSRIPQDIVGTFAGIGAKAIRQTVAAEGASIRIWRSDPETLGVLPLSVDPEVLLAQAYDGWAVLISPRLLRRLADVRRDHLPNETGGILLGGIDHDRKRMYVMLSTGSPPDSEEWTTHYIRGCEALREEVKRIQQRTAANLVYVGEWHSHPEGSLTQPSADDKKVFGWIAEHALPEGRPPVMLIAGGSGKSRLLVGLEGRMIVGEELCV